jgi:hypothetical protein
MKQAHIAQILIELHNTIDDAVIEVSDLLAKDFKAHTTNNELAVKELTMNLNMVDFIISSSLNSKWKKCYDNNKKDLDVGVEATGTSANGQPGSTISLYSDNILSFTKRQNVDGTTTLMTDFVNALSREGVSKEIIDAAKKRAEKPKRGNVYYDVIASER